MTSHCTYIVASFPGSHAREPGEPGNEATYIGCLKSLDCMGQWNGTVEWKMEWNGECTQLQLTCVTGAVQE